MEGSSPIKIQRALLSVSDKTGIVDLAKRLVEFSVDLISTGGTAQVLRQAGIPVRNVSDLTGFNEMLGGRVKTLHPKILGALLALRQDSVQLREAQEAGIELIDLLVVNLYPFEKAIRKPGVSLDEALENIDIGGPTMIRAAAKNFSNVAVLISPEQYEPVLSEMEKAGGSLSLETRRRLAVEAFHLTSIYDELIQHYLGARPEKFPQQLTLRLRKLQDLRYGENPHQKAALYQLLDGDHPGVANLRQLHGKELSFNNILDVNAALGLLGEFDQPCAVIIKHNNPCGVGVDENLLSAFAKAKETDPVSAFGGIVAFNRAVEPDLAEELAQVFLEVVIAPHFQPASFAILQKKKNLRLLQVPENLLSFEDAYDWKKVPGGLLLQETDSRNAEGNSPFRVVSKRQPSVSEWEAMRFGWKVAKWVKSNAVVYVRPNRTIGIGAGQMSRVDSAMLAAEKANRAGLSLQGTAVASDAFFPFRDGVDTAATAGATAVIQPGGSVRDEEVIQTVDEHGMAMVFTGVRHFRH